MSKSLKPNLKSMDQLAYLKAVQIGDIFVEQYFNNADDTVVFVNTNTDNDLIESIIFHFSNDAVFHFIHPVTGVATEIGRVHYKYNDTHPKRVMFTPSLDMVTKHQFKEFVTEQTLFLEGEQDLVKHLLLTYPKYFQITTLDITADQLAIRLTNLFFNNQDYLNQNNGFFVYADYFKNKVISALEKPFNTYGSKAVNDFLFKHYENTKGIVTHLNQDIIKAKWETVIKKYFKETTDDVEILNTLCVKLLSIIAEDVFKSVYINEDFVKGGAITILELVDTLPESPF